MHKAIPFTNNCSQVRNTENRDHSLSWIEHTNWLYNTKCTKITLYRMSRSMYSLAASTVNENAEDDVKERKKEKKREDIEEEKEGS